MTSTACCGVLLLLVLACALAAAAAQGDSPAASPYEEVPEFAPEEPCSRAGGICLLARDCPDGQLSSKSGLCPKQRSKGVECCHGLSVREHRCSKRGGECMARCAGAVQDPVAKDCPQGQTCCILVAF